ncbi:hypothetical protein E2R51_13360 [Jeotgalibacillus sp. S-D1]|uniref:hypothetical protein n=1 Tax=Jeotgalibacillus sp. S-D1 TaxID=2552189 RepID=UPI001059EACD|nr:hypothetical protein [Jeotgalibacillus sp. S-D1]TDL31353.1 hypothetical protein E2R51_13360 [Jeotgalibacillus sp. S-D1]
MGSRTTWFIAVNVLSLICIGWAAAIFLDANQAFANMVYRKTEGFDITIPLAPFFIMFLLAAISFYLVKRSSKDSLTFKKIMLPPEFSEQDERERSITANACRNAYISLTYTLPVVIVLMTLQPLVNPVTPYFFLWIVLLIPFIQWISYYITIRKLQN